MLDRRRELGRLPADAFVLSTQVTSSLVTTIARSYGCTVVSRLLVGFKYMADVLAHLDLAKVFGNAASRAVVESEHEQTADAIAAAGIAVEISTAGLRKAAGELYPAPDLLRALHRRGVPITLGSDGHVPEDLGRDYDRAVKAAHACGYRTISMFSDRERREVPLG